MIDDEADVIIIGGGPAGLSAALWCRELDLTAVLIERERELGGQLHRIHNPVHNYLGVRARNGEELLDRFRESIEPLEFARRLQSEVLRIDAEGLRVELSQGTPLGAKALIIATGVRRKKLHVPGEDEFLGKGILDSGVKDAPSLAGRNVLIVGGGDAAIENALLLSDVAASVNLVHRRGAFSAREGFQNGLAAKQNVVITFDTVVKRIVGDSAVAGVELENVLTRAKSTVAADAVLIRIGVEPNSELTRGVVDHDRGGFILVNQTCETSVTGIFAVGDVANPLSPTVSTAAGTAATAAKAIFDSIRK